MRAAPFSPPGGVGVSKAEPAPGNYPCMCVSDSAEMARGYSADNTPFKGYLHVLGKKSISAGKKPTIEDHMLPLYCLSS